MARLLKVPGGWKVRGRDGSRNAQGKAIDRSSPVYVRKADAAAEKRRRDLTTTVRRELRGGAVKRVLSLQAVLTMWGEWAVASDVARPPHVAEVQHVLGQLFERRGWLTIVDLRTETIAQWRCERGGTGTDKPLGQIKALMRYARDYLKQPIDAGVLSTPGRRGVQRRAQPDLLTDEQVAQLVARARERGGDDCAAIIEHLATYGCRPIDACRLRVRDLDGRTGVLTLGQRSGGTKNRETVAHPLLQRHLDRYRAMCVGRQLDDPLFLSAYGAAWRIDKSASQLLDWYTANVSEHVVPRPQWGLYCLKDYAITAMDRAGIDDRTKALFTGHRSLAVFERYKATNQERAVAALQMIANGIARVSIPTEVRPSFADGPLASAPQVRPESR